MRRFYHYILLSLPLVACGGGGGGSDDPAKTAPDYSQLSQAELKSTPLREASAEELATLIKNGLRISLRDYDDFGLSVRNNALTPATNDHAESGGNFSTTNVQVAGVDEADSVKYDGQYIYLATPVDYSGDTPQSSIKIFSTDPDTATVTEISNTPINASYWGNLDELYLVSNSEGTTGLASIRRSWSMIHLIEPMNTDRAAMTIYLPYDMDAGINIDLYDVRNPVTPTKTWSLGIDGDLLGSRKIGNMLYIVSSFRPAIDTLDYDSETLEEKINNENVIATTHIEKLMPEYMINEGTPQPLTSSDTCLIPGDTTNNLGYLNLVNVTAINLATQQLVESICINTHSHGVYVSADNLYLGGSEEIVWNNINPLTVIHKFSLTEQGIDYKATGSAEGYIGWQSPSFRMDEHNDYLRVVTTRFDENGLPVHQLHVFHEADGSNQLAEVARLPNETHPEPIGKPREDIYAVRFHGDKAYVVTFERIDPLYVLNLANPEAPQIAGELELPGFSTYLHPIGDNYVFSLGNETDDNGLTTAIKTALFDIRDMSNPLLVNQHLFGNRSSWSEALYDHRALSFLQTSDDQIRVSFPTMLFKDTDVAFSSEWIKNSLQLLEINGLTGDAASLDHIGEVIGESNTGQEFFNWYGNGRGLLHNDSVFYIYNDSVIGSFWE